MVGREIWISWSIVFRRRERIGLCFFFQAEDGIRDKLVTGVQTCALPIFGAIAGMVGTMAMTSTMRRLHKKLPPKQRYPLPPREIVDAVADPPGEATKDLTIKIGRASCRERV